MRHFIFIPEMNASILYAIIYINLAIYIWSFKMTLDFFVGL